MSSALMMSNDDGRTEQTVLMVVFSFLSEEAGWGVVWLLVGCTCSGLVTTQMTSMSGGSAFVITIEAFV